MTGKLCAEDVNLLMDHDSIILEREEGFLVLTSSINLNGFGRFKSILNHSLGQDVNLDKLDRDKYLADLVFKKNIPAPAAVVFNQSPVNKNKLVTIDAVSVMIHINKPQLGILSPISTIILVNRDLDQGILLKLMIQAAAARASVLWERGIPVGYLPSDGSTLIAGTGDGHPANIKDVKNVEESVYECVIKATKLALKDFKSSKTITEFLSRSGVEIDDLVEAAVQLLVGVKDRPELRIRIKNQLKKSLEDINVISLVMAGIRVEEDYQNHRVAGVDVDDDPAYLYSDEVLGMAIANQIAGTKAIFNFKRYDEKKPGILSRLGPMMDDVCAGLIAGCMSKIFEE